MAVMSADCLSLFLGGCHFCPAVIFSADKTSLNNRSCGGVRGRGEKRTAALERTAERKGKYHNLGGNMAKGQEEERRVRGIEEAEKCSD